MYGADVHYAVENTYLDGSIPEHTQPDSEGGSSVNAFAPPQACDTYLLCRSGSESQLFSHYSGHESGAPV